MELRQLEYFVAVAEERSFTRAAQRVHISQSGVSAQIRQLELQLGAPLIDRSGRTATLTAAGAAALPHARAALAAAAAVGRAVDDVNGLVRGRLAIGMVVGCTIAPLFDALAAFHRDHPGVEVGLAEDNSDRLVDRVATGDLDLALVGTAGEEPSAGLEVLPIVSEPLAAAVAPGHPLAGRRRVRLAELAEHDLVCLPRGTGIRTVFDRACAEAGVRPSVALEATAPDAVADLAARGLGIAVLSASMLAAHAGRLRPLEIADARRPAVLALVWATAASSPALRGFLTHARRAFSAPPAPAAAA